MKMFVCVCVCGEVVVVVGGYAVTDKVEKGTAFGTFGQATVRLLVEYGACGSYIPFQLHYFHIL